MHRVTYFQNQKNPSEQWCRHHGLSFSVARKPYIFRLYFLNKTLKIIELRFHQYIDWHGLEETVLQPRNADVITYVNVLSFFLIKIVSCDIIMKIPNFMFLLQTEVSHQTFVLSTLTNEEIGKRVSKNIRSS